jgi:hypothetical protein
LDEFDLSLLVRKFSTNLNTLVDFHSTSSSHFNTKRLIDGTAVSGFIFVIPIEGKDGGLEFEIDD